MNNNTENHWYNDILNMFGKIFNQGIYLLLSGVYAILINISNSEIISGTTISHFYARVQLIIGIFMVFRLTLSVLQGIIDPDKFTDSKTGFGNIIVRMITSLALLTMLVPINIPKTESEMNDFEKHISSSGLMFGILYDFQNRILRQNVLAKLVLGTNTASDSDDSLTSVGDDLAAIVLKTFFTPNLKEESSNDFQMETGSDGISRYKQSDLYCETRTESEGGDEGDDDPKRTKNAYEKYYKSNDTNEILNMINEPCETTTNSKGEKYIDLNGWDAYAFNFNWFVSLICGIIFLIVLLLMCIEVAKRAIKLAILRLIAPIPIISYMDPKTSMENGAFGSWVKTLTSTYLDLFINLLVIFFVIFIIGEINNNGLSFGKDASGTVVLFSKIFIYIGLLLFAKDAPKFIKQALGIKDDGGKGWFSGLATAAGLGAAALGAVGAARTNYRASKEENDQLHPYSPMNKFRNVGSALVGGMAGMATGTKAALTAKDHNFKAATDAMQARNDRRAAGYTTLRNISGRLKNTLGNDSLAKYDNQIKDQKAFSDYYDHAMKKADVDDTSLSSLGFTGYGSNDSVKSLKEAFERTKIAGASQAEQKIAEDRYKEAQAKLVGAVIKGTHTTGQAEQIKLDYDMSKSIAKKYEGTDYELKMPDESLNEKEISGAWKGTHFVASDNAYKIEQSDDYARAKLNDQISKK